MKFLVITWVVLVSWLSAMDINGQCSVVDPIAILDKDTTVVSFLIDGAQVNDLGINGVCGFNINFTHDFLGDVSIILVSPSGQEVHLIGPSLQTSPNTQFVRWNVNFIPCAFSASPDPGITPVWYNVNNWFQFTTYVGSYYPHLGCLEDLNSGTVNGTWSVKIIDAVDFGAGIIDEMSIIFCDPTGINCASCIADAGTFTETSYNLCEGQEELLILPEINYGGSPPDSAEYVYKYAIFNSNSSYISDSIDLRSSIPGIYEVCGMSVNRANESTIPPIQGISSKGDYESLLETSFSCASLTTECIIVTILDVRDTIVLTETICSGDTFNVDGQSFSEEGTYIVSYNGPTCDTMTILHLNIFTLEGSITGEQDLLNCSGNNVLLDGSGSMSDDSISFRWFTLDGMIRSDTFLSSILVSKESRYFLELTSGFCVDTVIADVMADNSFIQLDFNFDTLDCNNESVLIEMTANQSLSNVRWDGPSAFSRVGDNIVVSDPGIYSVTVTSVDNCSSIDSVEIIDGYDVEDPVFNADDITCIQTEVSPGATLSDTSSLLFLWTGPNGFSSDILNPTISEPGGYTLDVTGENGCVETWNLNIGENKVFPVITTFTDTLNCTNQSVEIGVSSSLPNSTYSWTGPNGFVSDQQMVIVDQEGDYNISVTSEDQCVTVGSLIVEKDDRLPSLVLSDVTINCADNGSTPLNALTDAANPSFIWQGPGGYVGVGQNPDAGVVGLYIVTVTGSNGCDRTGTLQLLPDDDVPDVNFNSEIINCDDPLRYIVPTDSTDLNFAYLSPTDVLYTDFTPLVDEPGDYRIRITDSVGCYSDFIHEVIGDTITPSLALSSLQIDCNNDSVMIVLGHDIALRQNSWIGPNGFNSDVERPYVDTPGKYIVNVVAENGCVNADSINVVENFDLPQITPINAFFTCDKNEVNISANVDMIPSTFEWEGPSAFVSNEDTPVVIKEGEYYVTVTGPNGCKNQDTLSVGYDTIAPVITLTNDGFLTCPDPVVTLTGTSNESNISTIWIGPDTIVSGSLILDVEVPGLWILEVIDDAGCISRETIEVNTEIEYPDVSIDYNVIDCSNTFSSVEVTTGPLAEHLFWQGPIIVADDVTNFNTEEEGDYSVLVTGLNGCDTALTFTVIIDTIPPEYSLSVSDTIDCVTPDVTINTENIGFTTIESYIWTGPDGFTSNDPNPVTNQGGDFIINAVGDNGCVTVDTQQVEIDTLSPIVQGIGGEITCIASKARLDVLTNIPNPVFNWQGPSDFLSSERNPLVVNPGSYIVTVTGENGCFSSDMVMLNEDSDPPRIVIEPVSYLFCDSTGINLDVSSDVLETTFIWFGDDFFSSEQHPFVDKEGTYQVFATGLNGCRSQDSTQVIVDIRLPEFEVTKTNIDCVNNTGTTRITPLEGDLSWFWTGPGGFTSIDTSLVVADSGTYVLTVQGTNLCIDSQSVNIEIDRVVPLVSANNSGTFQCEVSELVLDGAASSGAHNITYLWTTLDGSIASGAETPYPVVDREGNYTLTVIDDINSCSADTTILVERVEQEFLDFILSGKDPSCLGFSNGEIVFEDKVGGVGPIMFSLDGGPFVARNNFKFLEPGTYNIVARDKLGCILSKDVTLQEPRDIFLYVGEDRIIQLGEFTDLEVQTNVPMDSIQQLIWEDTTALQCLDCLTQTIAPRKTTLYKVTLVDLNGCTEEAQVVINVLQEFKIDFPNIIRTGSSNGNDRFYISQTNGIRNINYLSIYDRWGDRMFHAENFLPGDNTIGWDGMFLGKPALPAVYVVISELELENGNTILVESDLTVVR